MVFSVRGSVNLSILSPVAPAHTNQRRGYEVVEGKTGPVCQFASWSRASRTLLLIDSFVVVSLVLVQHALAVFRRPLVKPKTAASVRQGTGC